MKSELAIANKGLSKIFSSSALLSFKRTIDSGSSGGCIFVFTHKSNGRRYIIKVAKNPRVSVQDQLKNWQQLSKFIPQRVPSILLSENIDGFDVLISEASGEESLHSIISKKLMNSGRIYLIWEDVIRTFVEEIWSKSITLPYQPELSPRDRHARLKRVMDGVKEARLCSGLTGSDCFNLPIILNGVEYPSLQQTFQEIGKITDVNFGIFCHGDPQPSNIVVNDRGGWYLVDYEWCGYHHDWRAMYSHFFGWFPTHYLKNEEKPCLYIKNGKLCIDYKVSVDPIALKLQSQTKKMYFMMSKDKNSVKDWDDINRYLAMLYLGDVRFLHAWKREKFLIPLIAEGVKTAASIRSYANFKSAFIFDGAMFKNSWKRSLSYANSQLI